MNLRTVVSIEEVNKLYKARKRINKIPLKDLILTKNGKVIDIDQKGLEEFEFTGLSNMDFITTKSYKGLWCD